MEAQENELRITILKYHSWYLCQISQQIMLLPTLIFLLLDSGFEYMSNKIPNEIPKYLYRRFNTKKKCSTEVNRMYFLKLIK